MVKKQIECGEMRNQLNFEIVHTFTNAGLSVEMLIIINGENTLRNTKNVISTGMLSCNNSVIEIEEICIILTARIIVAYKKGIKHVVRLKMSLKKLIKSNNQKI